MALISNTNDMQVVRTVHWAIPPGSSIDKTQIPRGMVSWYGLQAVAALGAGDTLRLRTRFILPTNFVYLLKSLNYYFQSDDVTISMENNASLVYDLNDSSEFAVVDMVANGISYAYETAQGAQKYYQVQENYAARPLMSGPKGDFFTVILTDLTPTSVAGDAVFHVECLFYDVEQAESWQLNTPRFVLEV